MQIWIKICAKYLLYGLTCTERSQYSQSMSWLGLCSCRAQGSRLIHCCYLEVPGGCGMYSNYYKVMGFCVMLFEMKHRQTKSEEAAGELPFQCQVQSVYWKCTYPLGMGPVSEGPGLSISHLAVWALNHPGHTPGFREMQPTVSEREELLSNHLQGLARMDRVPCNVCYRGHDRRETRKQEPANSYKTSRVPCKITGYILKNSGRTEKLIATYKSRLINVHFTSAKFYILLLSYVNWAAFCVMINRPLNKQILLLEITLWEAILGFLFVWWGLLFSD